MKRGLLATFMALFMVVVVLPMVCTATYQYSVNGGTLKFDPSTGTIMGAENEDDLTCVEIPREILGVPVKAIGDSAFSFCDNLVEVLLPDTVTRIGNNAFATKALEKINIPDSVTIIGDSAFRGTSIETIVIPGSVKIIPESAFSVCDSLKTVILEDGVEVINGMAFNACSNLEKIIIPNSLKEINALFNAWGSHSPFFGCDSLKTITFGNGLKEISENVFWYCDSLETVYFTGDAPSLGKGVFNTKNNLIIYYPAEAKGWSTPTWNGYISKPYNLTIEPITPPVLVTATPSTSTVLVDGNRVDFDAYVINDNNYFKLRDIAFILSGSKAQFEVTWSRAKNAILLVSKKPYTPVGGEMSGRGIRNQMGTQNLSPIILDGKQSKLKSYTINGNNYFKLRDIAQAFNFNVSWDGVQNLIIIETVTQYSPE